KSLAVWVSVLCWLVAVITTNGQDEVECPQEISDLCPGNTDYPVYFPYPDDCGAFCECSGTTAFYLHCKPGLFFNENLNVCDWPQNVDCGTRPTVSSIES
ncbi:hypothetical protein OTU49_016064, partial [Cherax quadricarinatus]